MSLPVPSRRGLLVALLGAIAGAAVTALIVLSLSGDSADKVPAPVIFRGEGFAFSAPKGWHALSSEKRAEFPGKPAAIIERTGRGIVVVKSTPAPKDQSLKKLTDGLTKQLGARFPDFRFVSARVARLRGGPAYLFTFVRTREKTAQSIALVKVGNANYTIDTVTKSNDQAAATEAAAIVRTFGP